MFFFDNSSAIRDVAKSIDRQTLEIRRHNFTAEDREWNDRLYSSFETRCWEATGLYPSRVKDANPVMYHILYKRFITDLKREET